MMTKQQQQMSQEEEQKSVGKEDYAGLDIDTGNRKRKTAFLKKNQPGQLKKEACLKEHQRKGRGYVKNNQLTEVKEGAFLKKNWKKNWRKRKHALAQSYRGRMHGEYSP